MGYNDIYRLRLHCRLHGAEVLNVLHFRGATVTASASGLANDFFTNMAATLRARASNDFFFEYVEVVPLVPYGGGPVVVSWPANTIGTVVQAAVSGTLAEVITIYTDQIGRAHRGRIYLAGLASGRVSAGVMITSQTTATQAFATALNDRYIKDLHTAEYDMGVWSRKLAGPDPPWSTSAFTKATSLAVRTICRNQRRRQIGVGR
jgi:hypothetical protein